MFDLFDRHFHTGLPAARFARNTVLLSLAGLLPALWLYISLTPGFWAHLAGAQGARGPFLRQILTSGLPVVVAVNGVALVLYARVRAGRLRPLAALGLDCAARLGLFAALNGAIFVASAWTFGAFGSDPAQALAVLGPTLARAPGFGNLAGVHIFATLVSALPLHMAVVARLVEARGRPAPPAVALACAALGIFAVQLVALGLLGRLLAAVP